MPASLTIGVYDPDSAYTQYYNNLANTIEDAFNAWMNHFDYTTGKLTIDLDFESLGTEEAASAGPAGTTLVGTNNGVGVLASSFATEIYSGTADGLTDGVLTIDTSYLAEAFAPSQKSDTYDDRLGIMEHEIGHMLGFVGFYDPATDALTDTAYESGYDQNVSFVNGAPYFIGPNAEADYGSAVPLDTFTIYHPYVPGEISVMSYDDQASSIQNLDVDILKDAGLPILTTEEETEHSVIRLYISAFGNNGDTTGIEHWTDLITNNKATLSSVAASLVNSTEFSQRYGSATSNTDFITALYQNTLGRSPDAGGLAYWVNNLQNGTSRADVLTDFAQSDEHRADLEQNANVSYSSSSEAEVLRMFESAFGRVPDPSGYSYWVNALNTGTSLNDVAASFLNSAEFDARYSTNLSNNGFVTALYENTLGRAADSAGLQFWTSLLQNGTLTRSEELLSFSDSPEHIASIAQLATARDSEGYAASTQAILGLIPNQTAQTATS